MADPDILDLTKLRRGCAQCSLQKLCLPAGIPAQELQRLDEIVGRRRPIERGARLFRPGDPLASIYVARDGALKTVSLGEDGEEQILGFHLPGELVGLDALGAGVHRCEAVALTTANVCEVPFDQLVGVAAQLPSLQKQLMRVIGQSIERDHDHVGMLGRRQADERIALFLHGLRERFCNIGDFGTRFKLPMSREEIANFLGMAIETVSRGFTKLQEQGVIAVDGRSVEIVNLAQLTAIAHAIDDVAPPQRQRV
jgi:CRP/FNR family transcriptional regulator